MDIALLPRPLKIVWHFSRLLFHSLILIILSFATVHAETYQVVRVLDGDTITILMDGQKQSILLIGIDTPEKSRKTNEPGQPYNQKATKFRVGMVLNQDVSIESYPKFDNYFINVQYIQ